ncbi:hypothetical protein A1O3_08168 [Capronia epimyces CBS 606.96]|uniref:RING-type domain-containing protein n=1 Tax=Capronia epimyces CBS 606.96 TaxID=1182542 RepID=W9XI65_9EURO|nr:uncharacterized protein A1O3_08168 [Capronia epimyces CBS 606.96]EXJ79883.1 hypothetical protein A1O3_08168 [Capronia epimyces CBS 606.96]
MSTAPNPPEEGQQDNVNPVNVRSGPPSWSFESITIPQPTLRHDPSHPVAHHSTLAPRNPTSGTAMVHVHGQAVTPRLSRRQAHADLSNSDDNARESGTIRRRRRPVANPFGTREEIESDGYQSPVADLFGRAWIRYREHQEAGRATGTPAEVERQTAGDVNILGTGPPRSDGVGLDRTMALNRQRNDMEDRSLFMALEASLRQRQRENPHAHPRVNPIDQQSTRPRPLESEEMTVNIACKICCEQKVDTLLEPCMHVAICHWCSEVVRERARESARRRRNEPDRRTDEEDKWKCPICRRDVTQSRRVYLA